MISSNMICVTHTANHGSGVAVPDTNKPGASLAVSADGTRFELTLNEPGDQTSTPASSAFASNMSTITFTTPSWQSATILYIPFTGRILQSEVPTLSYTAGANPIRDLAQNNLDNFSGSAVTNGSLYELETVVDTQLSNGSIADTEYVVGRAGGFYYLGGGGGGDGGATQGGSGGAGEWGSIAIAAMLAGSYSWTLGSAGAGGSTGTATAGGDTEVLNPSSTVIGRAKGGSPGVGGAVGTGGAGGTGGIGDVLRAGGSGSGSAANTAGGGTSGSATAASGGNAGAPEGTPGSSSANTNPGRGVGGTIRTGSPVTGSAGGAGQVVAFYQRAVLATLPRVTAVAYGRDLAATTSRVLTIPGAFAANTRLAAAIGQAGVSGGASMTGYTEVVDTGASHTALLYVRDSDNSDTMTLVTASTQTAWINYRIAGGAAVANVDATSISRSNTQLDPPSHTHSPGAVDGLWLAGGARAPGQLPLRMSLWSSGYSQRLQIPGRTVATTTCAVVCCMTRLLATVTENPGTMTSDSSFAGADFTAVFPKA